MSIRVRRRPTRIDCPVEGAVIADDGVFILSEGGHELRYAPTSGREVVVYESQVALRIILSGPSNTLWVLGSGGLIVVVDGDSLTALAETSLGTELQFGAVVSKSVIAVATCTEGESSVYRVHFEEVLGEPSFTAECILTRHSSLSCISACAEGLVLGFTDDSLLMMSAEGAEKRLSWTNPATPRCSAGTSRGVFVGCSDGSLHCVTPQGKCIELPPVHTSSVVEVFRGDDSHIWTLDDSGKVVLWNQSNLQPRHTTTISPDVTKISLSAPFNTVQMVGVLSSGQLGEWDVGHSLSDISTSIQNETQGEAERLLSQLCGILKGQPSQVQVPSQLVELDDAMPFLPEALRSLAECRRILVEAFAEFGWSSESLHQDLQRVVSTLHHHNRQEVRAEERACQLIEMCPQFELPNAAATDRLLFACDCALECLTDRLASAETAASMKSDVDEARSTNYVLQSRIDQLEQQVEKQAKESKQAKELISQYEADVRELTSAMQRTTMQYERRIEELGVQARAANAISGCLPPERLDTLISHLPKDMGEHVGTATDVESLIKSIGSFHNSTVSSSRRRLVELQSECEQLETELDDVTESEKNLRNRHHRLVQRCREGGRLLGELETWVRRQQFAKSQEDAVGTRLQFVISECLSVPDPIPTPQPSPTGRSSAVF